MSAVEFVIRENKTESLYSILYYISSSHYHISRCPTQTTSARRELTLAQNAL